MGVEVVKLSPPVFRLMTLSACRRLWLINRASLCVCMCVCVILQREILSSVRLAALPSAFGIRTLPAQATEYCFAFILVPQDVSTCTNTD